MGEYEIVRATVIDDAIGFDTKEGKAIKPERHKSIKSDNSKSRLEKWWRENKGTLEAGKYELLKELENCKKIEWTENL